MHRRNRLANHAARLTLLILFVPILTAATSLAEQQTKLPELIAIRALFDLATSAGNPELSPDGKLLSYVKASEKGIPQIWVRTVGRNDDRMIGADDRWAKTSNTWSRDGRFILYLRDSDGDENFHLFGLELKTGQERDFTPFTGVKAQNLLTCDDVPGEVLIALNLRDRTLFDMYRVDLDTGAISLDTTNPGDVRWWLTDHAFQIRACVAIDSRDSHQELRVRDGRDAPWRVLINWPFGEAGTVEGYGSELAIAFSLDGKSLFVQSALHADTTQLLRVDILSGREQVLAHDPKANIWNIMSQTLYDFAQVLFDRRTGEPQAVAFDYLKPEWKVLDPSLAADFAFLQAADSVPYVVSRSRDDKTWLVGRIYTDKPGRYYLYDRAAKRLDLVFPDSPLLQKYALVRTEPFVIIARDGARIPCYLTLPAGIPAKNLPLVLTPHGGPWARDDYGFNPDAQFLANRGYAVLSPNFRGSTGYGKAYMNAGNGQWGVGVMQNDLTDAVKFLIQKGIADPKRVAIYGGSYGGYATLAGIAFTPDLYACAVDLFGPANVKTMLETTPPFWQLIKRRWIRRIGDAEHDEALNRRISPVFHADAIRAPLLVFHGVNDPRVKIGESEQIVAAMRKNKIPVTFVVYSNEGHGFAHMENILDSYGRLDEFLATYLGGRFEPWKEVKGSTAELR
jgi:dipeptidyl aminopeptidase/acylaminoacyl peptidase